MDTILSTLQAQRRFFASGATKNVEFRLEQLRRLEAAIKQYEQPILDALYADFRKPHTEGYLSEIYFVLEEIKVALRHLRSWARPVPVPVPLPLMPARARVEFMPFGNALIISPWNYPFQLLIAPVVAAMAAGNTCVLKPSELAPATSHIVAEIIAHTFKPEYIAVVEGGVPTNTALLEQKWDYIFFTGGTEVGRIVAQAAAKHLTPTTLELGGKSPCVVDAKANLDVAARRVAWGKYFNAGQTCIAPDYVLVDKSVEAAFTEKLRSTVQEFFGENPQQSPDYARIINDRHFTRLTSYLNDGDVLYGGQTSAVERYIAPTALTNVAPTSRVMTDEIFGPILPILSYNRLESAIEFINARPRPLALYVFTENKRAERAVVEETISGGTMINGTLMHISVPDAPFGGVGDSGIGAYHGKYGFETFSHKRTVASKPTWLDLKLLYAPYGDRLKWLKKVL
jgi:acyl-CoA reductase-like NAD-dependent aldehyde dehydrogenase